MNHEEFETMVENMKKQPNNYKDIQVAVHGDNGIEREEVTFTLEYGSISEMDIIKKRLIVSRIHVTEKMPKDYTHPLDGKVVINELVKCDKCGHEERKNVTREVAIKLLGGDVRGW